MNKKESIAVISTSFKLHGELNQQINSVVVRENYGLRGKSKWIKEAVESLFSLSNYIELVALSDTIEHAESIISVRFPRSVIMSIENAVVEIRKSYPDMEGVKSRIFRTAILQRLLRT